MNIPRELIEHFAKGNGVIFVGEELSVDAGLPDRDKVKAVLASELEYCPPNLSYQDVAQYYVTEHERVRFVEQLRRLLDTQQISPTAAHTALVKLPTQCIFTTNYDDLLEQSLRRAGRAYDISINNSDMAFWTKDRLQVLKLHGDLERPDSIVSTAEDHEAFFTMRPALTRALGVALQSYTALFLGYTEFDHNFRQLLTQIKNESDGLRRNAFAVLFNAHRTTIDLFKQRGIRIVNLTIENPANANEAVFRQQRTQMLANWLEEFSQQIEAGKAGQKPATVQVRKLPPEPYKFLDFFTQKDSDIFHGRERERDWLLGLILSSSLTILYGESGTGKTSLLQAAVLPHAQLSDFQIAYTRPLSDSLQEVRDAIISVLPNSSSGTDSEATSLCSLVENRLPIGGRLLLVLDQFEEVFIRQGPGNQNSLIRDLIDLLSIPQRDVRCLLSLRSDYLARLDELQSSLGRDPLLNRMHLYNLGPAEASAAIIEPAKDFQINVESTLLDQLLIDLKQTDVAPAQLQIVCYELWQDWQNLGKPPSGFTLQRYRDLGDTSAILAGYLDRVIHELDKLETRQQIDLRLTGDKAQAAARAILKSMISAEQTKIAVNRREITQNEIMHKLGIDSEQVRTLLGYLSNQRIIRRLPDSDRYELAHEVMIEKVWEWVSDEEKRILDLRDLLARATSDYIKFKILLPTDRLDLLMEQAKTLSLSIPAAELLLVSAIEYNRELRVWVSKMESEQAIKILIRLLENPKRAQLPQIAKALGYTHSPKVIRYLQELLRNENNDVQRAAIEALINLSLPGIVPPLYRAAQREDKLPRIGPLLDALERVRSDEAISMLVLIASSHANLHARSRAATALLRLSHPQSIDLIVAQMNSDEIDIRQDAMTALQRLLVEEPDKFEQLFTDVTLEARLRAIDLLILIKSERAAIYLLRMFQDKNALVRRKAIESFREFEVKYIKNYESIGMWGEASNEQVTNALIARLEDEDNDVRLVTVQTLGELKDERTLEPLLMMLKDVDASVRHAAVQALGAFRDERALEPLLMMLKDTDASVRHAAVQALSMVWELPTLIQLSNPDANVRRAAIQALGALRDERVLEPLLIMLKDTDTGVRLVTIQTLGELKDERALEPLLMMLKDVDASVRRVAIQALGALRDERALEPLLMMLKDVDASVRRVAIQALGALRDERVLEPLLMMLKDTDTGVRLVTVQTLGELKNERALEPLLMMLKDVDASVRRAAVQALSMVWELPTLIQLSNPDASVRRVAIQALGALRDERVLEPLLMMLKDTDTGVRLVTIQTLGELKDERALEPLLMMLKDTDASVRRAAIQALGALRDERALEPLLMILKDVDASVRRAAVQALSMVWELPTLIQLSNPDTSVRRAAIQALGALRDERVLEPLLMMLKDVDASMRRAAIQALGALRDERALEPFLMMLKDTDTGVRLVTVQTLGELKDERTLEPLLMMLKDVDASVRHTAVQALGAFRDERALEPLLIMLKDTDTGVRLVTIQTLGELKDERALEPLLMMLKDTDASVRRAAIQALGALRDERVLEPLLMMLKDVDASVRRAAIQALGMVWELPTLIQLSNPDVSVRLAAVQALGKLKDERTLEPLLAILSDADNKVRLAAIQALGMVWELPALVQLDGQKTKRYVKAIRALGTFRDKRAVKPLLILLKVADREVRLAAIQALGMVWELPTLIKLGNPDVSVRLAAVQALGKLKDERALEPLLAILSDADNKVRLAAIQALGALQDEHPFRLLLTRLNDTSISVRLATVQALGELRDERTLEPLLAILNDTSISVRLAAVQALGELRDERTLEPLLAILNDMSIDVRIAAIRALGALRDKRAAKPLLPLLNDTDTRIRSEVSLTLNKLEITDPLLRK